MKAKVKISFGAVVVLLLGSFVLPAPAQQDEENVRGAFLTSRPKEKPAKSSSAAKPVRRRPKTVSTSSPGSKKPDSMPANPTSSSTPGKSGKEPKVLAQRLGLGLTLFARDTNGLAVRVDPSHEFRNGDNVRILLETNADGYLYIFNTTDGGEPSMIYPGAEIDDAGNYIQSHVPFEIPSSTAEQERLRWFRFDEVAGNERLYFVFTREPLPNVPIEDDLIAYCRERKSPCAWKPDTDTWAQVQQALNAPLKTNKSQTYGKKQTASEHVASSRGIGLSQKDPEPSLIMMAVSTGSQSLVTSLDLIHK